MIKCFQQQQQKKRILQTSKQIGNKTTVKEQLTIHKTAYMD